MKQTVKFKHKKPCWLLDGSFKIDNWLDDNDLSFFYRDLNEALSVAKLTSLSTGDTLDVVCTSHSVQGSDELFYTDRFWYNVNGLSVTEEFEK